MANPNNKSALHQAQSVSSRNPPLSGGEMMMISSATAPGHDHQHPPSQRYRASEVRFNKFTIFCGPFAQTLFFLFLPASLNFPPLSPSTSPENLVNHYRKHETGLRGASALMSLTAVFWPIFVAGVNRQLARIPGVNPIVLYTQIAGGSLCVISMMCPSFLFAATVYRLDRDPVLTQLLSDLSWLTFTMAWPPFIAQDLAISWAILSDRRPKPLFPRWLAYTTTGLTIGLYPALGVHCVHSGVLAWNGALTFWVGMACAFFQMNLLVFYLMRAAGTVDDQEKEEQQSGCEDLGS
ncbi:hypothetical protein N7462_009397 [Penicillium macrosclerotiorum]|uniref:uncharacterized protein n=1 Tax=Penicillium macrosclerotiorum TaxID=303699 RepID=UPI00254771E9|nr:uncharacterized protein N7462_009397 [Penicillium macrosclerotiorum]KAJ5673958.1 hypothetical protein N7462_009397 [Penicillium macrosclerotiorum]